MNFNIVDRVSSSKIFAIKISYYCEIEESAERLFPGAIDAAYIFYVENVLSVGEDSELYLKFFINCNPPTQMVNVHECLDICFNNRQGLSFNFYNDLSDENNTYYWKLNKWTKDSVE
jgi:hypothetical protein